MNGKLVLACAISVLALSAFGATAAAHPPGGPVSPPPDKEIGVLSETELEPGATVTVRAVCPDPGFTSSEVTSPALTAERISRTPADNPYAPIDVAGKINDDAKAGTYPVSFSCSGVVVATNFTVVEPTTPAPPQVPVKPRGAADTGSLDPAPVRTFGAHRIGS